MSFFDGCSFGCVMQDLMDEVRNRRPFFTCSKRKLGEGVVPATQWKFNMHTTNDDLESRKVGSGSFEMWPSWLFCLELQATSLKWMFGETTIQLKQPFINGCFRLYIYVVEISWNLQWSHPTFTPDPRSWWDAVVFTSHVLNRHVRNVESRSMEYRIAKGVGCKHDILMGGISTDYMHMNGKQQMYEFSLGSKVGEIGNGSLQWLIHKEQKVLDNSVMRHLCLW